MPDPKLCFGMKQQPVQLELETGSTGRSRRQYSPAKGNLPQCSMFCLLPGPLTVESGPTLLVSGASQCTVGQVTPAASAGDRAQAGQAACSARWRLLPCSTRYIALHAAQETLQIVGVLYATPQGGS